MAEAKKGQPKSQAESIEVWRQVSTEELQGKLAPKREELFRLRQDFRLGKVRDTSRFKKVRREIAQLLTVLKEKEFLKE